MIIEKTITIKVIINLRSLDINMLVFHNVTNHRMGMPEQFNNLKKEYIMTQN